MLNQLLNGCNIWDSLALLQYTLCIGLLLGEVLATIVTHPSAIRLRVTTVAEDIWVHALLVCVV